MTDRNMVPVSPALVQMDREDSQEGWDEPKPVNPLVRLNLLLYGRYPLAIVLGLVLGLAGACAAFFLTPAKYEIVGYVRVKPYVQRVLYASEENGMLPSFETYVDYQVSLLQGERVMLVASHSPDWTALHRVSPDPTSSRMNIDSLTVEHTKGTELIEVTATDRDVNAAAAAVKSLLEAYQVISGDTENQEDAKRLQLLQARSTDLSNRVRGVSEQIAAIVAEYGTDDLSQQHSAKTSRVANLDVELDQIELLLAKGGNPSGIASTQPERVHYSAETVAAVDRRMQDDLLQKSQLQLQIEADVVRLGEKNSSVLEKRAKVLALERQMDDLIAEHESAQDITGGELRDRSRLTPDELRAQKVRLTALRDDAKKDELALGRLDVKLRDLNNQLGEAKKNLQETNAAIDRSNLEATVSSRIEILSKGERPNTPPKSKRLPLTAAGGVGGLLAGIGLIAVWGYFDPRIRSVLHAQQLQSTVPMLGLLPVLSEDIGESDEKSLAAHCVHQIRNLLDTAAIGTCRTLGITSPNAGDGKTSLTLALGLSFAAAGSRTLLVDCDMVGGGLTRRTHAIVHRSLKDVLLTQRLVTAHQLQEALSISSTSNQPIGEVLIRLNYVGEKDLETANRIVDESSIGLLDVLAGETPATCITPFLVNNLSILPLGDADQQHSTQLSARSVRSMLGQLQKSYDVILIDTGPVLGSLEASIVAREVDQVVLAVARNGQSGMVTHAIDHLQSLGVNIAGIVFNRANARDMAITPYGSSMSMASIRSVARDRLQETEEAGTNRPVRLGSLVAAVVKASDGISKNGVSDHVNGSG